jgi:hypothetical protein
LRSEKKNLNFKIRIREKFKQEKKKLKKEA